MREYNYLELLWHNIRKLFLNLKNKVQKKKLYRRDRLVQNIPTEDLGYEDLAPDNNIENGQGYLDALFWSINNENVKNIALTGPYNGYLAIEHFGVPNQISYIKKSADYLKKFIFLG